MPCIYCGTSENLTESDVIPDFMTNGRIINPNVCKEKHNCDFSNAFESYVINELAFLLNQLDIKSSKSSDWLRRSRMNGIA